MRWPKGKIGVVQVSSGASCNALLPSTRRKILCAAVRRVIDRLIFLLRARFPGASKHFQPFWNGLISMMVIGHDSFQFQKRRQLLIRVHNETPSIRRDVCLQFRLFAPWNRSATTD